MSLNNNIKYIEVITGTESIWICTENILQVKKETKNHYNGHNYVKYAILRIVYKTKNVKVKIRDINISNELRDKLCIVLEEYVLKSEYKQVKLN